MDEVEQQYQTKLDALDAQIETLKKNTSPSAVNSLERVLMERRITALELSNYQLRKVVFADE